MELKPGRPRHDEEHIETTSKTIRIPLDDAGFLKDVAELVGVSESAVYRRAITVFKRYVLEVGAPAAMGR